MSIASARTLNGNPLAPFFGLLLFCCQQCTKYANILVHLVVVRGETMGISSYSLLFSALFLCLGALSALVARAAARDARALTREMRSNVNALELEVTRCGSQIKRLTSSVGALGRWAQPKAPPDPNELPDPDQNPEKWRAAVRLRALNAKNQPKGELQ